jgi:hypothetical protein
MKKAQMVGADGLSRKKGQRLNSYYYIPSVGSVPMILPSLSVVEAAVVEVVVAVVAVLGAVVVDGLVKDSTTEINTFIFVWFLLLVNLF